jgi:hypothetical protein
MARSADDIHDELLVLRCQDGEAEAIEELVARWQHRLWRHAWHLVGCMQWWIWYWLLVQRNAQTREIKRLELQVAKLASVLPG